MKYCMACRYFTSGEFGSGCTFRAFRGWHQDTPVHLHQHWEYLECEVANKNNDCSYYRRAGWRLWNKWLWPLESAGPPGLLPRLPIL